MSYFDLINLLNSAHNMVMTPIKQLIFRFRSPWEKRQHDFRRKYQSYLYL